jgi:NADH-quinone oxidoreductase subunit N
MPPGFSSSDFVYLLPELVVAAGAIVVLVLDLILRRPVPILTWGGPFKARHADPEGSAPQDFFTGPAAADRVLAVITLTTLVAGCAALLPSAGHHATAARGLMAVDAFALFFDLLFLGAAALTVLMSSQYLAIERVHAGEYYFLVLCATLGMLVMAAGIDLVTIFVGLETMAVSFYVLAGFIRPSRRSNEAAVKYFVLGTFSVGILLYGMSLLYGLTGSTHLRTVATALAGTDRGRMLPLAVMLLAAGIGFKIAAVPFHMWAPDVYEGAPTPITALLSVGSKAASFAMLMRIFLEGLPAFRVDGLGLVSGQAFGWRGIFYVLSIATMTLGNLTALGQTNTKRLLAYSSVAHAGYVLIGVVAGPPRGITASLVYFVAYALMQLGAFAVVVTLRRRDVIGDELKDFTGLARSHPAMAFAMLVFLLSLGGVPATAGFMGKLWLFGAALDAGYVWLAVIGVLNSALSLYYYARIVVLMWTTEEESIASAISPSSGLVAVVTVAAVGTILLGIYPRFLFEIAASSAASLGVAAR